MSNRCMFPSLGLLVGGFLVAGPGCASIQAESSVTSTVVGTRSVQGPGRDRAFHGEVKDDVDAFTVVASSAELCTVQTVNVLRRTRTTRRTIRHKTTLFAEYGVGAVALLGGLGVTYDARNVPSANDPMETNPVGRTGAYGIGIGLGSVGVAAIIAAIIDTRAARDSREGAGEETAPIAGKQKDTRCNERPASTVPLRLGTADGRTLDLGKTGSDGAVRIRWQDIPGDWLRSASWVQTARVIGPEDAEVTTISLKKVRAVEAERAWVQVATARSSRPIKQFRDDFSDSHEVEATRLYVAIRSTEIHAEVTVAVGAKDLKRATELISEWATLAPDNQVLPARRAEVATLARDVHLADYSREFDTALAAVVSKEGVAVDSLQTAQARLNDLSSLMPVDPLLTQRTKRFEQTRRTAVDKLIAEANRRASRREFDEALSALDRAAAASPDDPRPARVRSSVEAQQKANAELMERKAQEAEERKDRKERQDKLNEKKKMCRMMCSTLGEPNCMGSAWQDACIRASY